ncbi:M24 family metallopeptidase [Robertmurraya massiliosenegalensis]|uniref:M24 family metallopeptidase n=1 Tax=Robertmurraya TaxID=2837507 RepID=UPI0039A566DE
MKTIQPVVLHGCSTWDKELFPLDEFTVRMEHLQQIMKEQHLKGVIIYSDVRNYEKVFYFSNYIPKHSYAILLISSNGDTKLLAKLAGTRDIPYVQTLTWVEEIRAIKNLKNEIEEFNRETTQVENGHEGIGICGLDIIPFNVYDEIKGAINSIEIKVLDDQLENILRKKRPTERVVMREAGKILNASVKAMKEIHRREGSVVTAVVEAERLARNQGAQDVRILYSLDFGRSLQPFDKVNEIRNDPMFVYIAIEYLGYWVDGMVTVAKVKKEIHNKTATLLQYFKVNMKSGVSIGSLLEGANQLIEPYSMHPITLEKYGYNIGLSLNQKPFLGTTYNDCLLEEGNVYSVHAGLTNNEEDNCLLSAIIAIEKNENEIIWSALND